MKITTNEIPMVLYIHFFIIISLKVFTFVDQSTNLSVHIQIQIPTKANIQNITGWMVDGMQGNTDMLI